MTTGWGESEEERSGEEASLLKEEEEGKRRWRRKRRVFLERLKGLVLSHLSWITMFPGLCLISDLVHVCVCHSLKECACTRDVCCDIEAASF